MTLFVYLLKKINQMDNFKKEKFVSRIMSGLVRIKYKNSFYLIKRATPEHLYISQEVYEDTFKNAELEGLYNDDELEDFMINNGYWDENKQKLLETLPKEIEEFKYKLFTLTFKSNERKVIREALQIAKNKLMELTYEKNKYVHLSCSGFSNIWRMRYIIGHSLYTLGHVPVFNGEEFWQCSTNILDEIINIYNEQKITDVEFRELSRTEPWRSFWSLKKVEGSVFGIPVCSYNEEQKAIVGWSCLYDSIFEHPDCPSDDIINDDDMLDGWMIDQKRQREDRQTKKSGEELINNEKIRNSQEVYLMADTIDDAKKIDKFNDQIAKNIKKRRFDYLKEKGVVNEIDMPDTKNRLAMEANSKLFESKRK